MYLAIHKPKKWSKSTFFNIVGGSLSQQNLWIPCRRAVPSCAVPACRLATLSVAATRRASFWSRKEEIPAERARRTLALSKLFLLKNARILRKFSLFCEFGPSKSEAKAKRTLFNFLRSEAKRIRFAFAIFAIKRTSHCECTPLVGPWDSISYSKLLVGARDFPFEI